MEGGGMLGVDSAKVGTIVWVRRRNGSWWPGRILGSEELSASHLMSPRSGTPVKLLGREDASVDWYNLEKSKRVKAFRCGEFDACIERAEASQGIPIKKREKYARREDAILHALELERQQLGINHPSLAAVSNGINNKTTGAHRRELNSFPSSDIFMRDDEPGVHSKYANHKSQMYSRKAATSYEGENMGNSLYAHKGKNCKQSVLEEDNPETLPRMRGLQDFGLRIAPPKKKFSQSISWETSRKAGDNNMDFLSNTGHMVGSASHSGASKYSSSNKRRRSQGSSEEFLVKKRDRRRPLVQVLQSSAKLPVSHSFQSDYDSSVISMQGERDHMGLIRRAKRSRCVYLPGDSNYSLDDSGYPCEQMPVSATPFEMDNPLDHPGSLAEDYTSSELAEATESDSSESDSSESDMEEPGNFLTDSSRVLVPGSEDCDPLAVKMPENFGNLSNDEMPLPGYMPQLHPQDQTMDASTDAGVSKWHMKGKRNIRNLTKRPTDLIDGKIPLSSADRSNGSVKLSVYDSRGGSSKMRRKEPSSQRTAGRAPYLRKEAPHYLDVSDLVEKDLSHSPPMGYGNRRYPFSLQAPKDRGRSHTNFNDSDNDSHLLSPSGWEADGPQSHMVRSAYWEESDDCADPGYAGHLSVDLEPMLVEVDLKVQAPSYQGEHVPLVSLMSRLNGKAIIGHPVQIEILEDGSTGHLVSRYDGGLDESTAPPPVWTTARRTVMQRVPRSNPAASTLDDDDDDQLQYSDPENKSPHKKAYSGYFNHQGRLAKKSISHARRPSVPGKFQKRLLKRASLSNQKTRTLSSLATEQRLGGENGVIRLSRGTDILDGLIKPEGTVPLVTCVPVKVVFSRILEAVGRPSAASAHRARMASPSIRGPS